MLINLEGIYLQLLTQGLNLAVLNPLPLFFCLNEYTTVNWGGVY